MAKKQSNRRVSSGRKPQGGSNWGWVLYPFTLALGAFVGVQAYGHFLGPRTAENRGSEGSTEIRQGAAAAPAPSRPRAAGHGSRPRLASRHTDTEPSAPAPSRETPSTEAAPEKSDPPATAGADDGSVSVRSVDPAGPAPTLARPGDGDALPGGTPAGMRDSVPGGQALTPKPIAPHAPVRADAGGAPPTHSTETVNPETPFPSGSLPAAEIDRGSGKRPEVALTFDAGSDWRPVKLILDTLAAENVKTTFFLTGEWVRKNPRTAQKIVAEGHELGNHSWNHPAFTGLKDADIRDQLRRTETLIHDTLGKSTHPYFRPPLGARDSRVRRVVADEGYLTIYWTLDSRDSVDKGITAEQIRDRVLANVKPGSIVLMHCGSEPSAEALAEILKGLKAKGLTPVTISRLLSR